MNKKIKYFIYISAIALYAFIGIYSTNYVTDWITSEYFDTLGDKAIDIAKITLNKYHITNDEVSELMSLSFADSLEHPANKRFMKLFEGREFSRDFKYAYIISKLKPEQVKYYVTVENSELFEADPDTPLDIIWLVDAVINQGEYEEDYYDDINRYTHLRTSEEIKVYEERKQKCVFTRDEYGNAITGYVPIYTTENDFLGMVGIDINFDRFEKNARMVRFSFILIFMLPTILLTLFFILVYFENRLDLRQETNTDPLTSLYNRRYLNNCMPLIVKSHCKNQSNLSVIMLDIDFFKKYNDNYGHQKGDEVLIRICAAISSALRSANDIACRYGGEEVILILKNTNLSGATYVAERIKNTIHGLAIEHKYSDVSDIITVSQGIYSAIPLRADKKTEEQFIAYADKALYEAKNSGRNKYIVYTE
ncbi:MAG: GGDEF domain-containing protein [Synergistaceae bacterium]|nr:GGDEF domain-containing protein [Synergistaceae bacterium]